MLDYEKEPRHSICSCFASEKPSLEDQIATFTHFICYSHEDFLALTVSEDLKTEVGRFQYYGHRLSRTLFYPQI